MNKTIEEVGKSLERCRNYLRLLPLVSEEVQSQYLHNLHIELDGLEELINEILKEV